MIIPAHFAQTRPKGGGVVDRRRWIALLISFNFAFLAVLGGFIYQKHLEIERLSEGMPESIPVFYLIEPAEPESTIDMARAEAAAFLDLRESLFSHAGSREGYRPAYVFAARVDGGALTVEVCKDGGEVRRVTNDREVPTATLPTEDGLEIARAFLARNGYEGAELRDWWREGNQVTARFATAKVTVGLDNGRVMGFLLV